MYLACTLLGALALSACTHDYDVFKPRGSARDAGAADGSTTTSAVDDVDVDDDDEPEPESL